jgi:hypothetical protein
MHQGLKKFLLSDVHSTGRHMLADDTVRAPHTKAELVINRF